MPLDIPEFGARPNLPALLVVPHKIAERAKRHSLLDSTWLEAAARVFGHKLGIAPFEVKTLTAVEAKKVNLPTYEGRTCLLGVPMEEQENPEKIPRFFEKAAIVESDREKSRKNNECLKALQGAWLQGAKITYDFPETIEALLAQSHEFDVALTRPDCVVLCKTNISGSRSTGELHLETPSLNVRFRSLNIRLGSANCE